MKEKGKKVTGREVERWGECVRGERLKEILTRRVIGLWEAAGTRESGMRWDWIHWTNERIRGEPQERNFCTCQMVEMRIVQGFLCKEEQGLKNLKGWDCRCGMRLN